MTTCGAFEFYLAQCVEGRKEERRRRRICFSRMPIAVMMISCFRNPWSLAAPVSVQAVTWTAALQTWRQTEDSNYEKVPKLLSKLLCRANRWGCVVPMSNFQCAINYRTPKQKSTFIIVCRDPGNSGKMVCQRSA